MRRQARLVDEFAAALDGRGAITAEREPALVPLFSLAQQLQAMPIGPRPEFRDALRARLLAVAAVGVADPVLDNPADRVRSWVSGWRVQRGLTAAAAGMAAVIGIAGVSVAGSRSLPGDPFYGVKRTAEGVQVSLARDDVARGKRHLQHAETRLEEVARLVGTDVALPAGGAAGVPLALGGSTADRVASALSDMDRSTERGARLLTRVYERERDADPVKALRSFAERQKRGLADIIGELPDAARDEAAASLDLIAQVQMRADALLNNGICGADCQPRPAPTPSAAGTPQPQPQPSPSGTPAPQPSSPRPEPSRSPSPSPSGSQTPDPSPSEPAPSPSPSPSQSRLPVPLPSPVGEIVEEVVDEVEKVLPTPLPSLAPVPPATEPRTPSLP